MIVSVTNWKLTCFLYLFKLYCINCTVVRRCWASVEWCHSKLLWWWWWCWSLSNHVHFLPLTGKVSSIQKWSCYMSWDMITEGVQLVPVDKGCSSASYQWQQWSSFQPVCPPAASGCAPSGCVAPTEWTDDSLPATSINIPPCRTCRVTRHQQQCNNVLKRDKWRKNNNATSWQVLTS